MGRNKKEPSNWPPPLFTLAWEGYKYTDEFLRLKKALIEKGFPMPYCENVIYTSFHTGFFMHQKMTEHDTK